MGGVIRGKRKVTWLGKWNHGRFFRERINYWERTLTSWAARIDSTRKPCREFQGGLPFLWVFTSVGVGLLLMQRFWGIISASVSISNRNSLVHPVEHWCSRYLGPSWGHFGGWIDVCAPSHNRPAQNQVRQTPWHRCRLLGIEAWGALRAPPPVTEELVATHSLGRKDTHSFSRSFRLLGFSGSQGWPTPVYIQ